MQNALPEAAVDRFRRSLERLISTDAARWGIAVSGGPDSLALLLLCKAAFPAQCMAATVDHGLRPESGAEAEYVGKICQSLDVPHATLTPATPITGSLQAKARTERYGLLKRWAEENGLTSIFTAHHADDQAETLLMRLNRGAGTSGLAGVRERNGLVLRPLLHWRRSELLEVVRHCGLEPVQDPSNEDDRFDRARIRKAMMGNDWLDPVAMARSAAALSESDDALNWMEDRLFAEHARRQGDALVLTAPLALPHELQRRLLIRCIQTLDAHWLANGPDIQRLAEKLRAGGKASIGSLVVRGTDESWEFAPAPPRRKN